MSVTKPLPHDSAKLHVTGTARYVDDIPVPADCLHLAFGLSDIACGSIQSINLDAVRAAPGVTSVWLAGDLPTDCDCSPSVHDEPLLSDGQIHYLGQPVFLVAATSHTAARHAARLGQIEYSPEPALLTIEDAYLAGSQFGDAPRIWERGTAAPAIYAAAHVIEGVLDMGGQEHFYLESQAAMVMPQDGGDMLVHSSTQHPSEIQHKVAHALDIPMHAVQVETRRMGGGFGGKESQGNALAISCAVVAAATGRPAKMRYDRDDDFTITGKRHDFQIRYRVGTDESGRIEGAEFLQLARCGWAQDLSFPVADRAMLHTDNAYFLPNVRIESHRLKTNTQSATAFRGFGGPQGMLGIERVMDHIAHTLGQDPLAVRRVNFYDTPETQSGRTSTPYGQEVDDFVLDELVTKLADQCDYSIRREAAAQWNETNPVLKRGIALTPVKFGISFTLTHLNQAGALVHVYQDGSIQLNHGGTEMGQGLFQKVAQVAASRFGVPIETIKITATDTGKVPNTSATAASSGSDLNGMAVKAACDTIRDRMATHLGKNVQFEGGSVVVDGSAIPFAEAAKRCYESRISLSATGFYKTPKLEWNPETGQGRPFFYFAYGAACSEVVIDTLTGENRILRTDIIHDAGASLNPVLDIGQVEGGFVQGAGWLTTEELIWDDKGRLRTHAPSTYKIPACSDRPDIFNVSLWDGQNTEDTIYRSKAVGEPPFMLGIAVLMALSDAVGACGDIYADLNAPATPERILKAVQKVRDGI
ncbi:xanthine dehydrogenase molybdopterin binding subunit [Pelagimonas varians]|uniref:Xanthine dehydrogenase molybdenum-binding subunit n=1 Tax=Pelagimonas varians TaxID=696760 RepID=A0A238KSA9_9RHOB|nr:xanthine dehydrogenase molybdopterin binding subunit [Pelagimonas varians]PYG28516.1 xanthine dehydrogenase molybdenum binding subunit apoprotein [Pelagimonas varians]SMX45002.1 Xanthine dehydrogenase molybdenum-binding subunit [Pelagimonas varians]